MRRLFIALFATASLLPLGGAATAEEASTDGVESVSFAVGTLADETRLVPMLMTIAHQLEAQPGVEKSDVRLSKRDVQVRYRIDAIGLPELVTAVESLGFRAATPAEPVAAAGAPRRVALAPR